MNISQRISKHESHNPKSKTQCKVPPLVELAILSVIDNLDALESVGDIPLPFISRILHCCSTQQLKRIEDERQDIDTHCYWKSHCEKELGADTSTESTLTDYNCNTWRQYFLKKEKEHEDRMKKFSAKAKILYQQDESQKKARSIQFLDAQPTKKKSLSSLKDHSFPSLSKSTKRSSTKPQVGFKSKMMQKTLDQIRREKQHKNPRRS